MAIDLVNTWSTDINGTLKDNLLDTSTVKVRELVLNQSSNASYTRCSKLCTLVGVRQPARVFTVRIDMLDDTTGDNEVIHEISTSCHVTRLNGTNDDDIVKAHTLTLGITKCIAR